MKMKQLKTAFALAFMAALCLVASGFLAGIGRSFGGHAPDRGEKKHEQAQEQSLISHIPPPEKETIAISCA